MIINWKPLPPAHMLLDATNLVQFSMSDDYQSPLDVQTEVQIEPENVQSKPTNESEKPQEGPIDTPMESIEVNLLL